MSMSFTLVTLALTSSSATAQSDLDFDQGELSEAWREGGPTRENYEIEVDNENAMTGSGSGHIWQTDYAEDAFGALTQSFPADEYRGQRLRLLGWVQTNTVRGEASLWMRVDGPGGKVLAFDNMSRRRVVNTSDWTMNFIVMDVPPEAEQILFGLLLVGDGEAWVDCLSFEVVDDEVPTTLNP
jgi:hypothetical protein